MSSTVEASPLSTAMISTSDPWLARVIAVTELIDNIKYAVCYPSVPQYEQWAAQAEQMGYNSVSRFITEMTETGYNQLNSSIIYDQEANEFRAQ